MNTRSNPLRIGHRGAAGHERENTIRSFLRAIDMGVDMIETDLRSTSDGAIVLFHDAWFEIEGARRPVHGSTLADLRKAYGDELATLEDFLAVANGCCGLMLEMKITGLAARAIAAVTAAGFTGPVVYASFHHDELLAVRHLQPDAQTLALIHGAPVDKAGFAIDAQTTHAGINIDFATAEFVSAFQRVGRQVFVYTVNEPEEIAAMKALQVDGIISDYPDRLQCRKLECGSHTDV
ncbi:MAG: glycerophosphodiester phosphodiesterase [Acidobacteriota bacterium]|nr:glycerophosphodiester phosphodiesterase [Acidobacteriota bacterium]